MSAESYIIIGKLLETIGAISLAYVGVKVACVEWFIDRHIHSKEPTTNPDMEGIRTMLEEISERRRKQFGTTEALLVGVGTTLAAIGCAVYLYGIMHKH